MKLRRIIVGFDAGACRRETLQAIAALAAETRADVLGVFIEDTRLLELARLPFAAEVGHASALPRGLELESLERALRLHAEALRRALAEAFEPSAVQWSFRVARGLDVETLAAALAEGHAPTLLIPPRGKLHSQREVVRLRHLDDALLRELIEAARPVLVLPQED